MDLHNGVQFKCYSCDKCYSRMDLLKWHEKIHGENFKEYCKSIISGSNRKLQNTLVKLRVFLQLKENAVNRIKRDD